jgi:UDP-N-acetylmuramate dehydrogenase
MQFQQNISLKPFNTFSVDVSAQFFSTFSSVEEIEKILEFTKAKGQLPMLVLGGGSNILFTKDFAGIVAKNECTGIELINQDDDHYFVKAYAGENWHQFVMYCITNNYAGLENLSLIPGNVGASPMQNIGAYGVEVKDIFHSLEAFDLEDKKMVALSNSDCEFGYRESVFKRKYKDRFVISSVTYRLNKKPQFHTSYGAIQQELEKMEVTELTIDKISQAVINIRRSKLPDPQIVGNAGSFFKNPTINKAQFDKLKEEFEDIVGYPVGEATIKVAAGWLIEQCGWKGYRVGDTGCHALQALVLVNYGNARGAEINALSTEIIESVQGKFGIKLEKEVNIF